MIVFGVHPVEEVLARAPRSVEELYVVGQLGDPKFEKIAQMAEDRRLSVRTVSAEEMDALCEGNHQRIAARVGSFPYASLGEVIERIGDRSPACVLVLEQVQDAGNLGAILRSAAAFDVDAVIVAKDRAAGVSAAVVRASAGMAFHVPVVQVTNIARALRELKEAQFWVVGTLAEGGSALWEQDWSMRAALVMGGEHRGIRPNVAKECDFRVTIPLREGVESLNVSVAAAIGLYDRARSLGIASK
ncbi:23S rRNA (guanosine(2251)-2'-O)-methyltransferase RlmB [Bradymonadaceae bacterium TMQ3]|uniref:23S rRNA (Guanosine(2251)-2'-O)-methyltransferase RlmB n=1 Tax=Lujinxingia sediminis TaxID=2480984 RepID=A0ABY0CW51_9DELT|nr:23S rRNA (guanosine(2251)-2'-O)-methyltransferase RlmB [Lujinxingia sediminis]RDV36602.1 23S rRNA (guanosine(2251)-2'-O)-methyltransferase RlmB [Bradymonadaceae bacterium TMQ3]RVU47005.1 23S rRNA (guanosine(2251)-2'-O)-methyltransferase RlmB [Lujinxingia sediminis]TXC68616.1 23S rRNA (guanosine(2251)-2'-O)-methyltransferase RlmB [Bradymonadales bacterium TMQ1]